MKKDKQNFLFLILCLSAALAAGTLSFSKNQQPISKHSDSRFYREHQGECTDASQYKKIENVILYLDVDLKSEFADVPNLTQKTIADNFTVSDPYPNTINPFSYCLGKYNIKTKVLFGKLSSSFDKNSLVLTGKLFQSTRASDGSVYLNITYQILWPEQKAEWKSNTLYQAHTPERILKFINDRVDRYLAETMGYVQPIQRGCGFNVQ